MFMSAGNSLCMSQLFTERLQLRPITVSDSPEIFLLLTDPEVNKYYGMPRARNHEDAIKYIESIAASVSRGEVFHWGVFLQGQSKIAGTICLWNFRKEESRAEIGYELLPAFHGKGMMKEAIDTVLDFGFEVLQLTTIDAWTESENISSIKILERCHFKRDFETEKKIDWSKEADFYRMNEESGKTTTVIYSLTRKSV